ncbi:unnamed protein product [Chilo suppressalis]|uniref:CUB domain-containing protein n=1 Tax=Chilo suppressalis TaxID=168631 RepID=A0ABN8B2N6_CHISP|nr:unnamed protein product [Chilo suppressalis]
MYRLESQALVTFWTLVNIQGQNWYAATPNLNGGNERNQFTEADTYEHKYFAPLASLRYTNQSEFVQKYLLTNFQDQQYSPPTYNQNREHNVSDIIGSSDLQIEYYKTYRNHTHMPLEVLNYNNTVNIDNIIKKTRSKGRIIKRRCPDANIRKTKRIESKQSPRTRFLEVFQVVEFEHVACVSTSGLEGTCLHEYECESSGGSMMGTCADGYGTCCVTLFKCDGQSSEQLGWFTNPGFPSPSSDRLSCSFTLNKASDDIKQIRLDFETFELLGPTDGTCQQDLFVVSGQNTNNIIPILCGINTGQHLYVEVGDTKGPIYLSVQTYAPENRLYSIKVSQLTWADELASPTGCLQYYSEAQGYIESFNSKDRSEIGIPRIPSYLNNLNYAICINRAQGTCSVTYTNDDYMQIVNYDLDGLPVIPQGQAGVEIFNCPSDWLLIAATRICGDRLNDGSVLQDFSLNAPVTDTSAGPITVWFRSDEGYVGRGFKLQYKQNSCNNPA